MKWNWTGALNTAANLSVIVASAGVLFAVWTNLSETHRHVPDSVRRPIPLVSGAKVPAINGVDFARSPRTLLLFMSVRCRYCHESVPFFRELAQSNAGAWGDRDRARVLAVFPEDAAEVGEFEGREGFPAEAVVGYNLAAFGVNATPTLILVSREGSIIQVWHGVPDEQTRAVIRGALRRA